MRGGLWAIVQEVVATWYGVVVVDQGRVVLRALAPLDAASLAERAAHRHTGALTAEEATLLGSAERAGWVTADRRLAEHGIAFRAARPSPIPGPAGPSWPTLREALMADADRALAAAWDPSVHVEEAIRAATDLDRVRNLVGERLGSWASRDAPGLDPGDHARAARSILEPETAPPPWAPPDPALTEARRRLAELYRSIEEAHRSLTDAVAVAVPRRTPNLNALLGPELSARLLAQAGGLDRLARLPASTVQVLGAEKAFFEHLRGRAPPPRHGLLFLHPAIQSAPRPERGKLARTLAGKVAIAARQDRAGAPVNPSLAAAFESRRTQLTARRGRPGRRRDERRSG
jgi:nucleolar protein 56